MGSYLGKLSSFETTYDDPATPASGVPGKKAVTSGLAAPAQRRAVAGSAATTSEAAAATPADELARMGELFGFDFSAVQLRSDTSATQLGALAYTSGNEVVFAPGQLDLGSSGGRELLAHELAHVVQQAHGWVGATAEVGGVAINDDVALEQQADEAAARVMRGEAAGLGSGRAGGAGPAQRKVAQRWEGECGGGAERVAREHRGAAATAEPGGASGARASEPPSSPAAALMRLTVDQLVRLYLADPSEAPITFEVAGTPVAFDAELLRSDSGRVRLRGALRRRFSELGGDEAEVTRVRGLWAGNSAPAALDLEDMLAQAVERSGVLGERADDSGAALVDSGRELRARTWGARRGHARTADGRPGRVMDGRVHAAMDVSGRERTGVFAPCAGRVIEVRRSETFGNLVRLLHEDPPPTACAGEGPLTTNYAHLDEVLVTEGATVAAGEAIGMLGMTGLAPGPHLHWSVQRVPASGEVGGFSSDYEEDPAIGIHPDTWLAELGTSVSAPSAPRSRGRRPRTGRSSEGRGAASRRVDRRIAQRHVGPVAQRWGERESDTMRAHRGRAEMFDRYGAPGEEPVSEGRIVHGDGGGRAPLSPAELEPRWLARLGAERERRGSLVPEEYVLRVARERASYPDIAAIWSAAAAEAAEASWEQQMQAFEARVGELLHTIENHFIRDPDISGLDVLGAEGAEYRSGWGVDDYPRGPHGDGEPRARRMHRALDEVRPERRPNAGPDAVITESRFDSSARVRSYIAAHLEDVPPYAAPPAGMTEVPVQPPNRRMLDRALEAFLRMRDAAAADGVALVVGAGWRSRETAAANAAASGNPDAVADFSAHTLGLAIDLDVSTAERSFRERSTADMREVTDMRESPVHRWMLVRGAAYGFYPFENEPWHWEYNPPGLRETLDHEIAASAGE